MCQGLFFNKGAGLRPANAQFVSVSEFMKWYSKKYILIYLIKAKLERHLDHVITTNGHSMKHVVLLYELFWV